MMPDPAVWEDIRIAYETSSETKQEIAARFGISKDAIYRRAKTEGWTLRPSGADALLIIGAKRAAGIIGEALPPLKSKAKRKRATAAIVPASAMSAGTAKVKSSGGTPTHQRAIIKRLYDVTDAKLAVIEHRIASGTLLKSSDAEREARDIAAILKTIEKLKELLDAFARTNAKSGEPKPGTAAANAAAGLADDADRLRKDLAERFARLRDSGPDTSPAV